MDMFERASRMKLRFPSAIGGVMAEDLWDFPLIAREGRISLESTAKEIHRRIKELSEESFVEERVDPMREVAELQLEIVKHIIADKIAVKKAAETAAETAQRKRKLLSALAAKEEAELVGMTKEQIEAEIAKL